MSPHATALDQARTPLGTTKHVDESISIGAECRTAAMVARRELIRFARARSRLASGLIQPLVFLFMLGYGLSPLVGTGGQVTYVQFMLPGVVAMTVVSTAIASGFSVVWDREFGFLREMLVAPPTRAALVIGKIIGGGLVATAQGTIVLLLAPLIGIRLAPAALLGVIGIEALTAIAVTAFGVFIASRVRRMESFQVIVQLLLMPMIFVSGAMFPLTALPAWLNVLAYLNPITYAVDPLRQVLLSGQRLDPAAIDRFGSGLQLLGHPLHPAFSLLVVAVFGCAFAAAAVRGFGRTD